MMDISASPFLFSDVIHLPDSFICPKDGSGYGYGEGSAETTHLSGAMSQDGRKTAEDFREIRCGQWLSAVGR